MSGARSFCAHLLALLAAALWLDEVWPGLLPSDARIFALILAGALFAMTLWFAAEEYISRRKLKTYLAAGKGVRIVQPDEIR
jgi:hypothetical protein